jgi:mannose-6-phosphate isomerase
MTTLPTLVTLLPTRVRRNYLGGRLLDELEGASSPVDTHRPETWLASTVGATNPGMPLIEDEGLTRCLDAQGRETTLDRLFAQDPRHFLGARHAAEAGTALGFLAKLLDSSIRLHVQVHPTAEFARAHLGAPHGKLEVYYVLAVREGCEGYIRLGFQRPPSREEWRRIIMEQDVAAMDACFDRIPVRPGEVWLVPGGMPHAIGEGVLMVEVMEPSDLVVRCEFERCGIVVPPGGRYMGRDLDFCLDVFDYTAFPPEAVRERSLIAPVRVASGPGWELDRLVGGAQTRCFELLRYRGRRPMSLPNDDRCTLVIQTLGSSRLRTADGSTALVRGSACLCAAAAGAAWIEPDGADCEALLCRPLNNVSK